jgi:hypothetical protein
MFLPMGKAAYLVTENDYVCVGCSSAGSRKGLFRAQLHRIVAASSQMWLRCKFRYRLKLISERLADEEPNGEAEK